MITLPLIEIIFRVIQPHSNLERVAFTDLGENIVHSDDTEGTN